MYTPAYTPTHYWPTIHTIQYKFL